MRKFNYAPAACCRNLFFAALLLLVSFQSVAQIYPVDTLMRNGPRSNRINMVYLSDGYQAAQLPTYLTDAAAISNELFIQTPFKQYKNYFNAFAISVPSAEPGAKHPGTAADEASSNGQPIADPDNNFRSTFDFFNIHRLLVPQDDAAINSALADNLPDYSQVFVVVNSTYYGGSGGTHATASKNDASAEIAIHEIGHSFAGLADEYWAGDFYAGEKANMTATSDPATVKWKNWIGVNGVGVYPYGATGNPANWFRPHQTCKMQFLNFPFCAVCTERFIDVIHQKVNIIDAHTPAATSFTLTGNNPVNFSISEVATDPSTVDINWYLNGSVTPFSSGEFAVTLPYTSFIAGNNTVRAEVTDKTTLSKSYLPGIGYVNNITWTVDNPVVLPVRLLSFSGKINHHAAWLDWEIDTPADLLGFDLEKSSDGANFTRVAVVPGNTQKKNYSYTDTRLFTPSTYYRLRVNEKDGTTFYSNVLRLQNAFDKFFYKVYQHAGNHQYHLSVGITQPEKISFRVTDVLGRVVLQKYFGTVEQQLDYDFDLAGKAGGIYFMTLQMSDYQTTIQLLAR